MESLVESLTELLGGLGKEVIVFIISMFPILELRGGLIASALLGVEFLPGYLCSIIGNVLPIPIVLLFLEKIFELLKKLSKNGKCVIVVSHSELVKEYADCVYTIENNSLVGDLCK